MRAHEVVGLSILFVAITLLVAGCTAPGNGLDGNGDGDGDGDGPPAHEGNVTLRRVAAGLSQPLLATHAGDGSGRVFIVEQPGTIRILDADGTLLERPFLDIRDRVGDQASEQGLLGLAFPPDYEPSGGRFYVAYTNEDGDSVLARYRASTDPDVASKRSEAVLQTVDQPFSNHNGGNLAFGPDGHLYYGIGDGGSAGDPTGNGQNRNSLLGAVQRLDVSASSGYDVPSDNPFTGDPLARDEIWAYGLRNPWRFSFDTQTGDLYIADVGQNRWEEVNFQRSSSDGGENYGWNVYEGSHKYQGGPPEAVAPNAVMPVAEYPLDGGNCSVTGGFVYRGATLAKLQGRFLFGDYCSGRVWTLHRSGGDWTMDLWRDTSFRISSFGQDEDGELYLVHHEGEVYEFVPEE